MSRSSRTQRVQACLDKSCVREDLDIHLARFGDLRRKFFKQFCVFVIHGRVQVTSAHGSRDEERSTAQSPADTKSYRTNECSGSWRQFLAAVLSIPE